MQVTIQDSLFTRETDPRPLSAGNIIGRDLVDRP